MGGTKKNRNKNSRKGSTKNEKETEFADSK